MKQTQQVQQVVPEKSKHKSASILPDVGDILYICMMQIMLFGRPSYLFQDCSIGWHLACGNYILTHSQIPRQDIVSYTFQDKAWVPYEWLFDLVSAFLTNLGGLNLLAVFCASIIAYVFVKTYDWQRMQQAPLLSSMAISIIAIFASAVHWLARPHIITFLCYSIFFSVLQKYEKDKLSSSKMLIYLGFTMILWVNSHPAFPLGLILIGIHLICSFLSTKDIQKSKMLLLALATTSATTLLNPNFFELHIYILNYLRGTSILGNTQEFLSPVFHGNIHALCLELLIFVLIFAFSKFKSSQRVPLSLLLTAIFSLHLALSGVRNIPIFALSVTPLIGFLLQKNEESETETESNTETSTETTNLLTKLRSGLAQFDNQEKLSKSRILSIMYTVAVIFLAFTTNMKTGFSEESTPTKTLEYIDKNLRPELIGNCGFNLDNWGGLILYKLKMRVFIDDRADFYGENFYNQYGTIIQTEPGFQDLLDQYKIKWVLLPVNAKLAAVLQKDSRWQLVAEDKASVIYLRQKQD